VWDFRFYEASAQILPVLYLAIVVEYRLFSEEWQNRPALYRIARATGALWLGVGFLVGEFQAVDMVSRGEVPTGHEPVAILTAYVLASMMLVWPLVDRTAQVSVETDPNRFRGYRRAVFWFVMGRWWLIIFVGFLAYVVLSLSIKSILN
jgi:hypothetical protein